jgi:hypothetical protein
VAVLVIQTPSGMDDDAAAAITVVQRLAGEDGVLQAVPGCGSGHRSTADVARRRRHAWVTSPSAHGHGG